ncbi:restriction endonuclease subunit S [Psychromonas sp. SP041]|uniref:restriction endonuclease subunit S n=1 Tax=Psychromonas sp. SP041 TaxID=1365007 RepID=UPI0003FCB3CB|nr:restriction endonuclease subunit S [Psychromonas sp. SP041]
MSELSHVPKEWMKTELSNIVEFQNGFAFKSQWFAKNGKYQVLKLGNVKDFNLKLESSPAYVSENVAEEYKNFKPQINDILITMTGTRFKRDYGFVCRLDLDLDVLINQRVGRIRNNKKIIDSKFLSYFLKSNEFLDAFFEGETGGVSQGNVGSKHVLSCQSPLPPLAEQKVIADKLDELLAKVESTKARLDAIPAILKSFRQSVLAAAVSGKLTEEWRGKHAKLPTSSSLLKDIKKQRLERWISSELEKKNAKNITPKNDKWKDKYPEPISKYSDPLERTKITEIPDNWVKTNLDTVSILTTGKTPSTTNEEYWNGELPFISPAQVHKNGHILMSSRHVSEIGSKIVPVIEKNSILIVCIGTVGKVGVLDTDAVINQQLNAITTLPSVLSEYMYYWSKTLYPWIVETSRATVNAAIINKSRLSEAPFALPSLEEQTEIVRRVEELFAFADKVEAQVNAAQERVNNLTQSILAKAFRGELTAGWRAANPDLISGENSAEALLKKIKAEREKLKPVKISRVKKAKA